MKDSITADILLVEDNPEDAELAFAALKQRNLDVTMYLAKDGEEALDLFFGRGNGSFKTSQGFPKLVLLDLKLPKVNGFQVLQQLKSSQMTKSIPVIILTSSRDIKDIKQCYELGANSYLVKPLDFHQFVQMFAEIEHYWINLNQPPPLQKTLTGNAA